jgi:hypothetical protein
MHCFSFSVSQKEKQKPTIRGIPEIFPLLSMNFNENGLLQP